MFLKFFEVRNGRGVAHLQGVLHLLLFVGFAGNIFAQTPQKIRLPDDISKHQPTILPVISSDGKRLYFDRKHHVENSGGTSDYDEIWFCDKLANGTWSKPTSIGAPLNTMGSDVLCSISPDDRTALVYGVYDKELPVKTEGFSLTHQHKGAWQFPVPIHIENFYNRAKKYYAQLAPDNRTLLLALQRDDALGGLDLYVSFRKERSESGVQPDTTMQWTTPKHLGNVVNTSGYDGSPHLAADGKTLYFSSEGLGGSGVADLFVARRLDDSWQHWSKPQNLGSLINTREEDSSIDVTLDGATAFFVSSNDAHHNPSGEHGTGADTANAKGIFTATLPDSLRHTGAVLLSGNVVIDNFLVKTYNIPPSARILVQAYRVSVENGKLVQRLASLAETTREESKYALSLPADTRHFIKANVVGYDDVPLFRTVVDTRTNTPESSTNTRFERRPLNITFGATVLTFPPVRFGQEQSTVLPEYNSVLAWIAEEATTVRSARLTITGHTCDLGTDEENDELSMNRAEAVAALLESFGVNHAQMLIRGRGEKEPLERSQMDDARVKNRRVEIVLKRGK
jgi:outer membrane protein OmpA-like peptidoglycan-associated protein